MAEQATYLTGRSLHDMLSDPLAHLTCLSSAGPLRRQSIIARWTFRAFPEVVYAKSVLPDTKLTVNAVAMVVSVYSGSTTAELRSVGSSVGGSRHVLGHGDRRR